MSSKRKNTPTKLASSEMMPHQTLAEHGSDGDSSIGSESDLDSDISLHIASHDENSDNDMQGTDCNTSMEHDRPPSKKQRILQSVRTEAESSDTDDHLNRSPTNLSSPGHSSDAMSPNAIPMNNNILTKPCISGLMNKKTMDNVIQRLQPKGDGQDGSRFEESPEQDQQILMGSIQAVLASPGSLEEKQRCLNGMIAQLQTIKDKLKTQSNPLPQVR